MEQLELLIGRFPGDTEATLENILISVTEWVKTTSAHFADNILEGSRDAAVKAGSGVVSVVVFILSVYFLTATYPGLGAFFKRFNNSYAYERGVMIKKAATLAFGGYIKAQLILSFIAFVLLLTAFTIYGQGYALLISLIAAICDFLPFLGTSAVLVPWAIFSLAAGNTVKAVFLVALSFSFFVIRRLLEPKMISVQIGVTPLVTLVSIYVGFKLAGIIGMILGPVFAVVILGAAKTGVFDNTKKDLQDFAGILANILRR
jgi:sporulation integral membrane protein YtvI